MITTVIPTYRRPVLLARAIQSVQNQNIERCKILVLDNCSGDETREVVLSAAQKDPRIHYICHSKNIGGFANFKFGYQQIDTPLFSFLSDDDLILPGFYKKALEALEEYKEAAFYACSTISIDKRKKIFGVALKNRSEKEFHPLENSVIEYIKGDFPAWTSVLFRKAPCEAIGGLPEGLLHDEEFVMKLILRFPYVLSNYPGAIFVCNSNEFAPKMIVPVLNERQALLESIPSLPEATPEKSKLMMNSLRNVNYRFAVIYFFKGLYVKDHQQAESLLDFISKRYPNEPNLPFFRILLKACKKFKWIQALFSQCCKTRILLKEMLKNFRLREFSHLGKLLEL